MVKKVGIPVYERKNCIIYINLQTPKLFCVTVKDTLYATMPGSSRRPVRRMRPRRPRRVKRSSRTSVSKATKKYVKRAIHTSIENKVVVINQANNAITTALTGVQAPYSINCIPAINTGAEQGERQGVVITPRVCTLKGFINLRPYNATTNPYAPIKVKMWLASYKIFNRNAATLQLADFNRFFEAGNSTVGFQGNLLDMVLPHNKSDWIIYETRSINLGTTSTSASHSGAGVSYDASRFSVPFSINVGKHLKQKLNYDDTDASRPTNRNMFLFVQAVAAEGTNGGSTFIPCEIHYSHRFEFEDA